MCTRPEVGVSSESTALGLGTEHEKKSMTAGKRNKLRYPDLFKLISSLTIEKAKKLQIENLFVENLLITLKTRQFSDKHSKIYLV